MQNSPQRSGPDAHYIQAQFDQLHQLIARWDALTDVEDAELDALIDAELDATVKRGDVTCGFAKGRVLAVAPDFDETPEGIEEYTSQRLAAGARNEMTMKVHEVSLNPDAIRTYCRKWKIRELCVFGSILRGDFRPDSDVDFVAEFDVDAEWDLFDYMDMNDELADIVGRKVDLLTRSGLNASGNRFLKREILSQMERIYAAG